MTSFPSRMSGPKPFDASFAHGDRYSPPKQSGDVVVTVDGEPCPGTLLGRNGPRAQVRFTRDGHQYVRWFDADAVDDTLPDEAA